MKFTTQHYRVIAEVLKVNGEKLYQTAWLDSSYDQPQKIHDMYVSSIANVLASDNPRFKRHLFERAADPLGDTFDTDCVTMD